MNERDELNWLAFRYVAGELDEAEMQAFESRLAAEQDAREAVARAVALAQCVAVASADEAVTADEPPCVRTCDLASEQRGSAWGWIAALAISAALLVLLSQLVRPVGRDGNTTASPAEVTAQEQLAAVWDAVREPLDEPAWAADAWEDADEALDLATTWSEPPAADEEGEEYWIEAAVMGLSATGGEMGPIQ